MKIVIVQDGITTELRAPDTLAGMVWVLRDHFDNIERGVIICSFDKGVSWELDGRGPFLDANSNPLGEETKSPGIGDVPH